MSLDVVKCADPSYWKNSFVKGISQGDFIAYSTEITLNENNTITKSPEWFCDILQSYNKSSYFDFASFFPKNYESCIEIQKKLAEVVNRYLVRVCEGLSSISYSKENDCKEKESLILLKIQQYSQKLDKKCKEQFDKKCLKQFSKLEKKWSKEEKTRFNQVCSRAQQEVKLEIENPIIDKKQEIFEKNLAEGFIVDNSINQLRLNWYVKKCFGNIGLGERAYSKELREKLSDLVNPMISLRNAETKLQEAKKIEGIFEQIIEAASQSSLKRK